MSLSYETSKTESSWKIGVSQCEMSRIDGKLLVSCANKKSSSSLATEEAALLSMIHNECHRERATSMFMKIQIRMLLALTNTWCFLISRHHLWCYSWATQCGINDRWAWTPATSGLPRIQVKCSFLQLHCLCFKVQFTYCVCLTKYCVFSE